MNTPLLLTSVALLAGVAARPIDRQPDDITNQDTQSHSNNKQVYLHDPNTNYAANSQFESGLNLDGIPHTPVGDNDGSFPKLVSLESAFSDPGLSSPYMGSQRHLSKPQSMDLDTTEEQHDALSMLSPMSSRPSSPALSPHLLDNDGASQVLKNSSGPSSNTPRLQPDYSPMIAVMVVSSLGALVLLGLAVAVAYVSQLLRLTVLQGSVWRTVTNVNKMDGSNLPTSNKPKIPTSESKKLIAGEGLDEKDSIILARRIYSTLPQEHVSDPSSEKTSLAFDPDQDPEDSVVLPPPALRELPNDHNVAVGRAVLAWTYDNWLTHFMFALFGWMGMFLRGSGSGTRN